MVTDNSNPDRPEFHLTTSRELARFFDVSERTVSSWINSGLPRHESGFEIGECVRWARSRQNGSTATSAAKQRKLEADAVLAEQRAIQVQLQTQREAGRLVYRDSAYRTFNEILSVIRSRLECLATELCKLFDVADRDRVYVDTDEYIRRLLQDMVDRLEGIGYEIRSAEGELDNA